LQFHRRVGWRLRVRRGVQFERFGERGFGRQSERIGVEQWLEPRRFQQQLGEHIERLWVRQQLGRWLERHRFQQQLGRLEQLQQ
jgi:hypothetical protein